MTFDRRHFLGATAAAGAWSSGRSRRGTPTTGTVPVSGLGVEAFHLGVRINGPEDQTEALQRAIDRTAGARLPLILAPGVYRARNLNAADRRAPRRRARRNAHRRDRQRAAR